MGLFSNANDNQTAALFLLALWAVYLVGMNMHLNNKGHSDAMDELNRERISSISGFSAGGSQLMNSYDPSKFERVFLIDPASTTAQSMKDYEGEVVFLYGWDVHEDVYGKEYSEIIPEVKEGGGIVENIDMNHYKFPKYTFSKYQNQL